MCVKSLTDLMVNNWPTLVLVDPRCWVCCDVHFAQLFGHCVFRAKHLILSRPWVWPWPLNGCFSFIPAVCWAHYTPETFLGVDCWSEVRVVHSFSLTSSTALLYCICWVFPRWKEEALKTSVKCDKNLQFFLSMLSSLPLEHSSHFWKFWDVCLENSIWGPWEVHSHTLCSRLSWDQLNSWRFRNTLQL